MPHVIYPSSNNASTTRKNKRCITPPAFTLPPCHSQCTTTPTTPVPRPPTPPRSSSSLPLTTQTVTHFHFISPSHPPSSKSRKPTPRTFNFNTQPSLLMAPLHASTFPMASGYTNYHPRYIFRTLLSKPYPYHGHGHLSLFRLSAYHITSPPTVGALASFTSTPARL